MKKILAKWGSLIITLIILSGLSSCSSTGKNDDTQASSNGQTQNIETIKGLTKGFPNNIPFYEGAKVIESDNFNNNNYTVLYSVDAEYKKVLAFYVKAFNLDDTVSDEHEAYFESFNFGVIFVKGLTIEDTGTSVNVFMTLEDTTSESSEDEIDEDDSASSDIMTYKDAAEVALSSEYPKDVVPIPLKAKVIGCSMVPGTGSGFVDLIMPASEFDNIVSFYAGSLSLTPNKSTTPVQEAAQFKGEIKGCKIVVMVTHLLSSGNDTLIQITINKQ